MRKLLLCSVLLFVGSMFTACETNRTLPGEAPVAVDDLVTTLINTPVAIDVLANDSDPDGDALYLDRVNRPDRGEVDLDGDSVIYTPDTGFTGQVTFGYTVVDETGRAASAAIMVTVQESQNAPPEAVDDAASTAFETDVLISVLDNDSDPDGDTLEISALTSPGHGQAFISGGTAIRYAPEAGFDGQDSFGYTLIDGRGGSDTATVTVTVMPPDNRPPEAVDDAATTYVGYPVQIAVLENDSDPEGEALSVISVSTPAHGTATAKPDGTITYAPQSGFSGEDGFEYTVADPDGASDVGAVTVSVSGSPAGCAAVGEVCDASQPDQGDFACVYDDLGISGRCLTKCDPAVDPDPCPTGSVCYDPFGGAQDFGACLPSDCESIFTSDPDCADQTAFGGTCLPVGNGASFCAPAGSVAAGGACGQNQNGPADEVCAPGILCIDGLCEAPCNTAEDFCPGGGECLAVFPGHPELGLCRDTCTPYQADACAVGFSCFPISASEGLCIEAGPQTEGQACGLVDGDCAADLVCAGDPGSAVCMRFCDPGAGDGEPGSCAGGEVCLGPNPELPYLGVCITSCDPYAADPGCPTGMGCVPDFEGGGRCWTVGSSTEGDTCQPPYEPVACAEGLMCIPATPADEQGTCQSLCLPFESSPSDCPGGFCRLIDLWVGTCTDQSLGLAEMESCPVADAGAFCDENVLCVQIDASQALCVRLCRLSEGDADCAGQTTCDATFGVPDLGACIPR